MPTKQKPKLPDHQSVARKGMTAGSIYERHALATSANLSMLTSCPEDWPYDPEKWNCAGMDPFELLGAATGQYGAAASAFEELGDDQSAAMARLSISRCVQFGKQIANQERPDSPSLRNFRIASELTRSAYDALCRGEEADEPLNQIEEGLLLVFPREATEICSRERTIPDYRATKRIGEILRKYRIKAPIPAALPVPKTNVMS